MKKKTIAIIGVLPPPYGGISVHIERLCGALAELDIPYVIYDESKQSEKNDHVVPIDQIERWSMRYLFKKNEDIIHNHFLRWKVRFTLSLLRLKGKKVIHTVHSLREEHYSIVHLIMIYFTGLLSNHFIVVNEEIKEKLLKLKIPANKITVIPAFIRPIEDESITIPTYINDVFENYSQVMIANGGIGNLQDGEELYGLDLCIEMFKSIADKRPNVAFLYCVTHVTNEDAEKRFREQLTKYGLNQRFMLIKEKMPLYPLLKKSNMFVRPTRSDGDAISIREALYYKVPVITSDVVKRPAGVKLFKNNDLQEFTTLCDQHLRMDTLRDHVKEEVDQGQYLQDVLSILNS